MGGMLYFVAILFVGIFLGILIDKYLFPFLDVKFEVFSYKSSVKATDYKLSADAMVKEFKKEYPDIEQNDTNAIGFHVSSEDNEDEDYDDDECRKLQAEYSVVKSEGRNVVGFKFNG